MKKQKVQLNKKLVLSKEHISALSNLERITGGSIIAETGKGSGCPKCVVGDSQDCTDSQNGASMCQGAGCTLKNCQTRSGQLGCGG